MAVKSQFLEIDVLLAIIILVAGVILIKAFFIHTLENPQVDKHSFDAVTLLNTMPMGSLSLSHSLESALAGAGISYNPDELVSRQIAILVIDGHQGLAERLAGEAIEGIIPRNFGYTVSFVNGTQRILLDSYGEEADQRIEKNVVSSSRVMLTGLQLEEPVSGYTGSIFVSSPRREISSYYYFGGFVGQGDISVRLEVPVNAQEITNVYLEGGFRSSFDLYMNGGHCHSENIQSSEEAIVSEVNANDCVEYAEFGENTINISFNGDKLEEKFISGGFIRISYLTDLPLPIKKTEKKYLPDIKGIFNLYDSIYAPGRIESMNITLEYHANYSETNTTIFFSIGNQTLFEDSHSEEPQQLFFHNTQIASLLDYESLENKTIPFRFGFENVTKEILEGQLVDLSVITDLSGSMNWNFTHSNVNGIRRDCDNESLYNPSTRRIDVAKCILHDFVDEIMDIPENRIGLIGFEETTREFLPLTNDTDELHAEVDSYVASGWTCIACGIYDAIEQLKESPSERMRVMLIMSDGEANRCDSRAPPYTANCGTSRAIQQTLSLAQQAYNEHNISIYTVAFLEEGSTTLDAVAQFDLELYPNNSFTGLDPEEIAEIYGAIARSIIDAAAYDSQVITIDLPGVESRLLGSSYIEYSFTTHDLPGEAGRIIITGESPAFGSSSCSHSFVFPNHMNPLDGMIISYSGRHWTDRLNANGENVYDLSYFGSNYPFLGDPFVIGIPLGVLGRANNFVLNTGDFHGDSKGCSPYNRLIYAASIPSSFRLDDVYARAEGCTWTVEMLGRVSELTIPLGYAGGNTCSYMPGSVSYEADDAWQALAFKMFSSFDANGDGVLDIDFDEQDIEFNMVLIDDIPYMWTPSILEVVVWQ